MAMRPLRKSAHSDAFQDQYGSGRPAGQLLGYFCLLCIFAVLAMILGGEVLVDAAPAAYADAAGLIPFTAAAFVMPAVYRTVNQNVAVPNKRPLFIVGCVGAALSFVGVTSCWRPRSASTRRRSGCWSASAIPALLLFVRNQRGKKPIDFPYREVAHRARARRRDRRRLPAAPELGKLARARDRGALVCCSGSCCSCRCA